MVNEASGDGSSDQRDPQVIGELLDSSWERFSEWKKDTASRESLLVPENLSNVFVPKRVLELAHDPLKVSAYASSTHDRLRIIIRETRPAPVTDIAKLNEWVEGGGKKPETDMSGYDDTWAPEGVDYMHLRDAWDMQQGTLSPNDYVYLEHRLKAIRPGVAYTINHFDRPEMRGRGISKGFFERLEPTLKELGFKYWVGQISSPNPGFFERDRVLYDDLSPKVRSELPSTIGDIQKNYPDHPIMVKEL